MKKLDVAIVGGGIAGLAAAYRARQLAPDLDTVLFEREPRLGGKIVTEHVEGFVVEGGPDSFLASKPAAVELCRELGLEERLQAPDARFTRTWVLSGGRLHELPEGLSGLVPARLGPAFRSDLLSPAGKLRFALDYVIPPRRSSEEESLASFISRRFGRQVYDRLVEPLMAGIYAGNGAELSLDATFPQLKQTEQEHGSLLRGLRQVPQQAGTARRGFLTPVGGMAELVEGLAGRLPPASIQTGTPIRQIFHTANGYRLLPDGDGTVEADAVIVATPAHAAAALLAGLDAQMSGHLGSIPHVSTATVSLAYRAADLPPLEGRGFIVPRSEGCPILACTWSSAKFRHRAPADHVLIRAFVGRAGQEELVQAPDETLVQVVRRELSNIAGVTAPPLLCRIYRWPKAMPQYTLGHAGRVAAVEDRLQAHPGLVLAGNAYRGIGIPDCIRSGEEAARCVLSALPVGRAPLRRV